MQTPPYVLSVPPGLLDQDFFFFMAILKLSLNCLWETRWIKKEQVLLQLPQLVAVLFLSNSPSHSNAHAGCCKLIHTTYFASWKVNSKSICRTLSVLWHDWDDCISLWHIHFPKPLLISSSSPLIVCFFSLGWQRAPDQNCALSTPCSEELMQHIGGRSNGFTQVLRLPPHADNLALCPISPILALLGWAYMPCRLFDKYIETSSL